MRILGHLFIAFLCLSPMIGCSVGRIYQSVQFDIHCGDNIKRASHANTVELAKKEMEVIVSYLEVNNMTEGYTSVLYKQPSEDVGFWYKNLKTSLLELKTLPDNATPLEKSNMLIKLRETLTDGDKGTHINIPDGISVFPNNVFWFWFSWFSFFTCIGYFSWLFIKLIKYLD